MRLADLAPRLEGSLAHGALDFECPTPGHTHRIRVLVGTATGTRDGEKVWAATGTFPDSVSLYPSVDASKAGCWHGYITNGEVR